MRLEKQARSDYRGSGKEAKGGDVCVFAFIYIYIYAYIYT